MMSAMTSTIRQMKRALTATLLVGVALTSVEVMAESRDADGSRLQARTIALGTTQRDSLAPPRDAVDWLSFKVSKAGIVSITIAHKPDAARMQLDLTDARGRSIGSATSQRGAASLRQQLTPGIYYISLGANANVSYSVTVK